MSYEETQDLLAKTLKHFLPKDVNAANKAVKAQFGNRFSQVRPIGPCEYSYYISTLDEFGEWELSRYDWDFFSGMFD